jgi:extracellular elastinolytic metalloproteinase
MHNRMHDWSYYLGFTEQTFNLQQSNFGRGGAENDPEHGNVQDGGIVGGPPTFSARDNANQVTPADGLQPITNMYLWQPIAGAFYAPCVDGDYDMSVIGHEYTHAITNRMIAGPTTGLAGPRAARWVSAGPTSPPWST